VYELYQGDLLRLVITRMHIDPRGLVEYEHPRIRKEDIELMCWRSFGYRRWDIFSSHALEIGRSEIKHELISLDNPIRLGLFFTIDLDLSDTNHAVDHREWRLGKVFFEELVQALIRISTMCYA